MLSAYRAGSRLDKGITTGTFGLLAVPNFMLAMILIYVFALQFGVLPATGWVFFTDNPLQSLRHALLPALALAIAELAVYTRLLRADMMSSLQEDYITMARAKGVPTRRILWRHALRPSSFSLMTVVGVQIGAVIGGAVVVVEQLFAIPGIGRLLFDSVNQRDLIMVQGVALVIATSYVVVNFAVDLLYSFLDPRIRSYRPATGHRDRGAAVTAAAPGGEPDAPARPARRRSGVAFWLAVGWLVIVAFCALFATWLPVADPILPQVSDNLAPPGPDHVLGTDGLGRDTLARLVHGARVSLTVSLTAVTVGIVVGGTLGMTVGYFRGWYETVVMRVIDVILAFPGLVLLLVLLAYAQGGRRGVVRPRPGADARYRRRVRFGKDGAVTHGDEPVADAQRGPFGPRALQRSRDLLGPGTGHARHLGCRDGPHPPGPDDLAEPGDEDRRPAHRAAAAPPGHGQGGGHAGCRGAPHLGRHARPRAALHRRGADGPRGGTRSPRGLSLPPPRPDGHPGRGPRLAHRCRPGTDAAAGGLTRGPARVLHCTHAPRRPTPSTHVGT